MFMIRSDVQINADGLTPWSTHHFNYLMFVPHATDILEKIILFRGDAQIKLTYIFNFCIDITVYIYPFTTSFFFQKGLILL